MVKCTEQDIRNYVRFYTSNCMKFAHNFAIGERGVFVYICSEWVLLDKISVKSVKSQKEINEVLTATKQELGRDIEDIDLLQQFVTK